MRIKQMRYISRILTPIIVIIIFLFSQQSRHNSYQISEKFSYLIKAEKIIEESDDNTSSITSEITEGKSVDTNYRILGFLNTIKFAHIILSFALDVFLYGSVISKYKSIIVFLLAYLYAAFDEIQQYFVGRTCCFIDTLYDAIGIIFAIIICKMLVIIMKRKTYNQKQHN